MTELLTITQTAQRTGLTADTLRYYERDGLLLQPPARSVSGHRRYNESDVSWIEMVTCLRATGMGIREVRRYAALVRAGGGNEQERLALLLAHRHQVLADLAEQQAHLAAIEVKVGLYTECLKHQVPTPA